MGIRGGLIANLKPTEMTIGAVITRADGRVEHLGTIAYYHRNPVRRWLWQLMHGKRTEKRTTP